MDSEQIYYASDEKDDVAILKRVCHLSMRRSATDRRIFHKECRSLSDGGFEVTYIVVNQEPVSQWPITIESVQISKNKFLYLKRVNDALFKKAMSVHAQIYHVHEAELLPTALKLKEYGKRVIYGAHQDTELFKLSYHWGPKFLRRFLAKKAIQKELKIAAQLDGIIAVTPWLRKKFAPVNSAVVDAADYPRLEDFPSSLYQKTSTTLLQIGNLDASKHSKIFVETVGLVQKETNVLGEVRGKKLRKILTKIPGWTFVQERGLLKLADRIPYFSQACLGVVIYKKNAYNQEKLPRELFELLAAGLPVLLPDFDTWKKHFQGHKIGKFADASDTKTFSRSLQLLLDNPSEWAQFSKNARLAFEQQFNWKSESKKYMVLYRKIAAKEKYGYN